MRNRKSVTAAFSVIGLVLGLASVNATPAVAVAEVPVCAAELSIATPSVDEAENKHPLLMVHGFGSDEDIWLSGNPSMRTALESNSDIVIRRFNYKSANDQWVTDPEIGHRLAKTIACYSKLYKQKVILLAHSMGGLASREALDWADSGKWVRDMAGHTITIATPHLGALPASLDSEFWVSTCKAPAAALFWLADGACRDLLASRATSGMSFGSDQLDKLAHFPSNISVKAIAGEVSYKNCFVWGVDLGCKPLSTASDLVVHVDSAIAESTNSGKGDGTTVFKCDTHITFAPLSPAWCEHGNMLQAPQVQDEVKKSIQDYIASTKKPVVTIPMAGTIKIGSMKMPMLSGWDQGMSESYVANLVDKTTCQNKTNADCPHIYIWDLNGPKVGISDAMKANPVAELTADKCFDLPAYQQPKFVGTVDVGGFKADYYKQTVCGPQIATGNMFIWWVKEKGIAVSNYNFLDDEPSYGLPEALSLATWN